MLKHNVNVYKGESSSGRISPKEALDLLENADIAELMAYADHVRRKKHGRNVHFVHSLNLNPTNVCESQCDLCAFWRDTDADDAYFVSLEEARERMEAAKPWQLTDIHVVGGLTKKLGLDYYQKLFRMAKEILPSTIIQGLTAVEIQWLADMEGLSAEDVLVSLRDAGLSAMPGGGAEIFSERVRSSICPNKISADNWLSIHKTAHDLGLPTNATMLFGHIETPEDIIDHLDRLRQLQDQTGGFMALCPLPFHNVGTKLEVKTGPSGYAIARIVALSRIFLDNFPHIRVLANFLDRKLLQTLLYCGADDIGGTSIDEQIARAAGAPDKSSFSSPEEISEFIDDLGFEPVLTNSTYSLNTTTKSKSVATCQPPQNLQHILELTEAGQRIYAKQAIMLHDEAPFYELGRIANKRHRQVVGGSNTKYE